jgi:rubredoxin
VSGGADSLESYDQTYALSSLAALSEEQRQQELRRQQQERVDAAACVARHAVRRGWPADRTREILQALGLVADDPVETWPDCDHPRTAANTFEDARGGLYCRRCQSGKSRFVTGTARRRYTRNKAGAE